MTSSEKENKSRDFTPPTPGALMLDWKCIDKEPPPKDGREILLHSPDTNDTIVCFWGDVDGKHGWHTLDSLRPYPDNWFTYWADIGPLPTWEPGHEP